MKRVGALLVGSFLSSHPGRYGVGEELSVKLAATGWNTTCVSHFAPRVPRLLDMLASAIQNRDKYQIAVVEVYSGLAFFWAEIVVALLKILDKPVVLALHGGGLAEFSQENRRRVVALLGRAQAVVTPSLFLQAKLHGLVTNLRYLPNAVNVDRYEFHLRARPVPTIVWMRAFHSIYDPQMAVSAVAMLLHDFPDLTLTMIGPDKHDGSLQATIKLARQLGVETRIMIVGPVTKADVPRWLAKGDVFLNTTRYESFGISVLEAALVGLPIVTTNVGELPLLWENERTAMFVAPGDAEAMAGAVQRVLVEDGLAARLSSGARRKAERFDWSVILPQWEALFQEVLDE